MPQQPQKTLFDSLRDNFQNAQWLVQFPALTIMPWLRWDLGFRMVSPIRTIPVFVFLIVVGTFASQGNEDTNPQALVVFAILTLAISLCQYLKRWIDYARKVKQHSYYLGTSRFHFKRTPAFLRRERRLERFLDPILAAILGVAIFPLSHALGAWLVISGLCLRSYEYAIYIRDRNLSLDIMDGMDRSEQQSQIVEEFETKSAWHKDPNTNGLSTGLDEDTERQITISLKRRKAKPTKNTIDI
jgi:hypothetical protein